MIKRLITILLSIGLITSSIGWLNMHNKVEATEKIVSEKDKEIEEQLTEIANLENEVAYNQNEINELQNVNLTQEEELKNKDSEIDRLKDELKKKNEEQSINEITVNASAYISMCTEGCSGITRSGYDVRNTIYYEGMRIIATDLAVIPMYSIVEIEGFSERFIVLDSGGAIKGNKIDILVNSTNEAIQFGRKNLKVKVIRRGR